MIEPIHRNRKTVYMYESSKGLANCGEMRARHP